MMGQSTATKHILIERNFHYCQINLFLNTLASLYVSESKREKLLLCKYLEMKKKMTVLEGHKKMLKFCKFVRE